MKMVFYPGEMKYEVFPPSKMKIKIFHCSECLYFDTDASYCKQYEIAVDEQDGCSNYDNRGVNYGK